MSSNTMTQNADRPETPLCCFNVRTPPNVKEKRRRARQKAILNRPQPRFGKKLSFEKCV